MTYKNFDQDLRDILDLEHGLALEHLLAELVQEKRNTNKMLQHFIDRVDKLGYTTVESEKK